MWREQEREEDERLLWLLLSQLSLWRELLLETFKRPVEGIPYCMFTREQCCREESIK